jgi:hypothetical protein
MSMWRFARLWGARTSYFVADCFSESSDKGSLKVPKLLACCAKEYSLTLVVQAHSHNTLPNYSSDSDRNFQEFPCKGILRLGCVAELRAL